MSDLTLEQQFALKLCQDTLQGASKDQLIALYIQLYAQTLQKDNAVAKMLGERWGLF